MLLSNRMQAVVGLVAPCASIADIGCDHGYVAIELISRCICQHVFAMDIHLGPLERAKHNIKEYRMQEYIETRQSNGMESLSKGEAEGVICAGMGGRLIISILERGQMLVRDMRQVVLQPQSEIDEVRAYLRKNGFLIEKEDIICEDGKYYPMMRALPNVAGKADGGESYKGKRYVWIIFIGKVTSYVKKVSSLAERTYTANFAKFNISVSAYSKAAATD